MLEIGEMVLISVINILIIGIMAYIFKINIKAKSAVKQDNIEEKRRIYKDIVFSIRTMFDSKDKDSSIFLKSYDDALLWGSDNVVRNLTHFLNNFEEFNNEELKSILAETIIEMRKDIDFNKTKLTSEDITFKVFKLN